MVVSSGQLGMTQVAASYFAEPDHELAMVGWAAGLCCYSVAAIVCQNLALLKEFAWVSFLNDELVNFVVVVFEDPHDRPEIMFPSVGHSVV